MHLQGETKFCFCPSVPGFLFLHERTMQKTQNSKQCKPIPLKV